MPELQSRNMNQKQDEMDGSEEHQGGRELKNPKHPLKSHDPGNLH